MTIQPYTVYDRYTGRILRCGQCQPSAIEAQIRTEDEAVLAGTYDPDMHFVHLGRGTERPRLGDPVSSDGQGFALGDTPPQGARIRVDHPIYSGDEALIGSVVALTVPVETSVAITLPFPHVGMDVYLDGTPGATPEDAQMIQPDLAATKTHYIARAASQQAEITRIMRGDPDDETQVEYSINRDLYARSQDGALTPEDTAALDERVRYSDTTVADYLAAVGRRIGFDRWATMRAAGVRQEVERRITEAVDVAGVLDAAAWGEAEAQSAIVEAEQMLGT